MGQSVTPSGLLDVGDGHRIHFEQSGHVDGIPLLLIHGGPGSGSSPRQRSFFDHDRFRIVQFDQRGCGKSEPLGEIRHNDTHALIADIERLRAHLHIDRWLVCGGSWGATLALAYATRHVQAVRGIILRSIFLPGADDLRWFFHDSGARVPDAYADFLAVIPTGRRSDIVAYLDEALNGADTTLAVRVASAWLQYEMALTAAGVPQAPPDPVALRCKYKIQAHYLARGCFLHHQSLLRDTGRLGELPVAIFHGSRDPVCRPQNALLVHRHCKNSTVAWAQDAGHDPFHPQMHRLISDASTCFLDHGAFR